MTDDKPIVDRRGLLLVLSSPSGAGKTSLARSLLEGDAGIRLSVSVTTRKPRPARSTAATTYFVDEAKFIAMREAGDLLEWARVFDNFYGTPKEPIETADPPGPRRAVRHRLAGHPAARRAYGR